MNIRSEKNIGGKKNITLKDFYYRKYRYPEFSENISKYIRSGSKMDLNNSIRRFILLGDI